MRRGFTLIELVLALLIASLVVLTINFAVQTTHRSSVNRMEDQLAWHYFLSTIRAPKYQFVIEHQAAQKIILKSTVQKKRFVLKYRQGELVLTTPEGGYLPLLRGLTTAHFEPAKKGVRSVVETRSGQQLAANLMLEDVIEE